MIGKNVNGLASLSFSLNLGFEFAICHANHSKYKIPMTFKILKMMGYSSNTFPNPNPIQIVIKGNPRTTPKIWGIVLLYPNVKPDERSIILFGPGVMDVAKENINIDIKSVVVKVSIALPF